MHFYRVYIDSNREEELCWAADFAGAKALAKTFKHNTDLYVDLVDLPVDKKAVLRYLNSAAPSYEELPRPLRSWLVTPRGGLKEVPLLNQTENQHETAQQDVPQS